MTSPVLQTDGLSKRYGRRLALSDCTLTIPPGHVVGLVGPNGAGKTTLLQIAAGMLAPTSGAISVLAGKPASGTAQLAKVGFVAQDTPTYASLSIRDHLRLGARHFGGEGLGIDREEELTLRDQRPVREVHSIDGADDAGPQLDVFSGFDAAAELLTVGDGSLHRRDHAHRSCLRPAGRGLCMAAASGHRKHGKHRRGDQAGA